MKTLVDEVTTQRALSHPSNPEKGRKIKAPAEFTGEAWLGYHVDSGKKRKLFAELIGTITQSSTTGPAQHKDPQLSAMRGSLRSPHPAEQGRAAGSQLTRGLRHGKLVPIAPQNTTGQSGIGILLFRLLFINTDDALPFHLCASIRQLPHKPVKNDYEHATHNYDRTHPTAEQNPLQEIKP